MGEYNQNHILFTGGNGRLGTEIKKLLPQALYPDAALFDVTNVSQMNEYVQKSKPTIIIHAAAFTSPPLVDKEPKKAVEVNIIGTANLVAICLQHGIKMVYISTDYVFKGDVGNYTEEDAVLPVNKYAWSKLGGECAVRMLDEHLIIRTSFGEKVFPYEKAFVDQYTSRESVDVIAGKIIQVVQAGLSGTIHLGHSRRSVYEYALSQAGEKVIGTLSVLDVTFTAPKDTSLNTDKYKKLFP